MNKWITMVIDGEVVRNIPVRESIGEFEQEKMIAQFLSDPVFVLGNDPQPIGALYDGSDFALPE